MIADIMTPAIYLFIFFVFILYKLTVSYENDCFANFFVI